MANVKPTGRLRYRAERIGWRKREVLVLQIEEAFHEVRLLGGWPDPYDGIRWRDAQVTDLPSNYAEVAHDPSHI